MRKEYVQSFAMLQHLEEVLPQCINFQKSIYKKYSICSHMTLQHKKSNFYTVYDDYNIFLKKNGCDLLHIEKCSPNKNDYSDEYVFMPDYDEVRINPCSDFTFVLHSDDVNYTDDAYGVYNAKSKIMSYDGIDFKIKTKDDCEAALAQILTLTNVTISTDEVWGMISVLTSLYRNKDIRNFNISFTETFDIKNKLVTGNELFESN